MTKTDDRLVDVHCKKCSAYVATLLPGVEQACPKCAARNKAPGGHRWCAKHKQRYPENLSCDDCNLEAVRKSRSKKSEIVKVVKTPLQTPTNKGIANAAFAQTGL